MLKSKFRNNYSPSKPPYFYRKTENDGQQLKTKMVIVLGAYR
jgi:hypothetical protein